MKILTQNQNYSRGSFSVGMKFLVAGLLLVATMFIVSGKAHAITENTSNIPPFISSFDKQCNGFKHFQDVWLSDGSNNSVTTVEIDEGTGSASFRLNVISAHCDTNLLGGVIDDQSIQTTRTTLVSRGVRIENTSGVSVGSPSISSGLALPSSWDINYGDSHANNYRYIKDGGELDQPVYRGFTVSGLAGLAPGDYRVYVTAAVNMVHRYSGPIYKCVARQANGNEQIATGLNDMTCGDAGPEWAITIRIRDVDNPPTGSASVVCDPDAAPDRIWGSATDADGAPVTIHVYIDGFGYNLGAVANPNFSWAFPDSMKDAFSRRVEVYALNIPPSGQSATAPNVRILDTVIPRCRPPTCNVPTTSPPFPQRGTNFDVDTTINYDLDETGGHARAIDYYVRTTVANSSAPVSRNSAAFWSTEGSHSGGPPSESNSTTTGPFNISTEGAYPTEYTIFYRQNSSSPYENVPCRAGVEIPATPTEIARYPYFKVYGNDVQAGGQFSIDADPKVCSGLYPALNNEATLRGFNAAGSTVPSTEPTYDFYTGAGVQFAIFALGVVKQVPSANMLAGDRTQPHRLTFANYRGGGPGFLSNTNGSSSYGGGFINTAGTSESSGMSRDCIPNYFAMKPASLPNPGISGSNSITPGSTAAGVGNFVGTDDRGDYSIRYYKSNDVTDPIDPLQINGADMSTVTYKRQTVYVDGDARIADNASIVYGSFNGTNMPNFTLVVRGNIYIDNSTAQLDGTYIAIPNADGSKGKIITCYRSAASTPVPINAISGECEHKLTVNGALIAKAVKPLRTNGSIGSNLAATPPENFGLTFVGGPTNPNPSRCAQMLEASDPGTWNDNWLCTNSSSSFSRYGLQWSFGGLIPGKTCESFNEPAESVAHTWNDNFLCYNNSDGHNITFYNGGPDPFPGTAELNAADTDGNYTNNPPVGWSRPGQPGISSWSGLNAATGKQVRCTRLVEAADSQSVANVLGWGAVNHDGTWNDNWVCENVMQNVGVGDPEPPELPNIAETFNFSPEIYLQPTNFTTESQRGKYDSYQTLPPIL